jgi:hypothetical protein
VLQQRVSARARLATAALAAVGLAAALSSAALAQAAKPAPRAGPDAERVKASFDSFASEWMERMQRVEDENRASPKLDTGTPTYRGYGDDFRVEIKPTGYAPAPYVGVLRYEERMYGCRDSGATECRVTSRMPVTELFRYQDGRWVY